MEDLTNNLQNSQNRELGNICYYPLLEDEIPDLEKYKKIPIEKITSLGISFKPLAQSIRSMKGSDSGFYFVGVPDGMHLGNSRSVRGKVFQFKKGMLFDENNKLKDMPELAKIPCDPTLIFATMALEGIISKLDRIKNTAAEILQFMEAKERADAEGNIDTLNRIAQEYRVRYDDNRFLFAAVNTVSKVLQESSQSMKLWENRISSAFDDSSMRSKEMINKAVSMFNGYKESIFAYSYASYLDIVISQNYKKEVLEGKASQLSEIAGTYSQMFSKTFEAIEKKMRSDPGRVIADGAAGILKLTGRAINSIPIIRMGPFDEALMAAGNMIEWGNVRDYEKFNDRISVLQANDVSTFTDNIKLIGRAYGDLGEILADNENLYVSAG